MTIRQELERRERQIAFTNWLAEKWNLTYEKAKEKQCKTSYKELKELCREWSKIN